ncbi:ABC transporter substrate-binding protein [Fodinicola feengrottensis]|uniref:ABC transporter substrate-binding protein n=1 Tax=Fodinicola feengrottensis TaxID=435914 RepID=UPI0013D73302|nr:extracellular solute-binding protein [Fodinicola feengrottensis]
MKFSGWDYESALVQQNVARFQQLNKDIKVAYTPITSAQYVQKTVAEFTGGGGPDALYVYDDSLAGWVGADYLQPIDGLAGVDEVYSGIYPSNAQAMTVGGKRYGLPYYTDSQCLIYNESILKKAGISAPPKSLDELEQQSLKIKNAGILQYPIGVTGQLQDTWWAWVWGLIFASGGDLFDANGEPTMDGKDATAKNVFAWLHKAATVSKVIDPAVLQLLPVPLDNAMKTERYAFTVGARYALRGTTTTRPSPRPPESSRSRTFRAWTARWSARSATPGCTAWARTPRSRTRRSNSSTTWADWTPAASRTRPSSGSSRRVSAFRSGRWKRTRTCCRRLASSRIPPFTPNWPRWLGRGRPSSSPGTASTRTSSRRRSSRSSTTRPPRTRR